MEMYEGSRLLAVRTLTDLLPGESVPVEFTWVAREGAHELRFVASLELGQTELIETNNSVSILIDVPYGGGEANTPALSGPAVLAALIFATVAAAASRGRRYR